MQLTIWLINYKVKYIRSNSVSSHPIQRFLGREFFDGQPTCQKLFANDLNQNPLAAVTVKFAVEDVFPGTEIEFSFGNGDDDFASHDLTFHVSIGVILTGAIVMVVGGGCVWCELFQPDIIVMMQAAFVVVDEHRGGDVHGIDEAKAFLHAALFDEMFDRFGDVEKTAAIGNFKPKLFGKRFHLSIYSLPR